MKKLTQKQHRFVCELLSGQTIESAYGEAYPTSKKWARRDRDSAGGALLRQEHIKEFYASEKKKADDAAREEARRKAIWTREQSLKTLALIVKTGLEDLNDNKQRRAAGDSEKPVLTSTIASSIIKAVEALNNMIDVEHDSEEKPLARILMDLDPGFVYENPDDYCEQYKEDS